MGIEYYRLIHDIYVLLDDGDRRLLGEFNLTTSQYAVMRVLDMEKGQRLTTLSEKVLKSKSTVTRIIDQLEQAQLVKRNLDPHDRRAQRVVLTGSGADLLRQVQAAHAQSLHRRLAALDDRERAAFCRALKKLRASLAVDLGLQASYDLEDLEC
ncbi:MAG: MarR family transcriptional regulator [Anaerolineae bacterium]